MDPEFLSKLKGTLQALIDQNSALTSRIAALEHSVNDVIIKGLTDAANEYEDNERFSEFVDNYSGIYSPFAEDCKTLYGDDYDIAEDLYARSRDAEDEKGFIDSEIKALQEKLDKLRAIKNGNVAETPDVVEVDVVEPSEEELMTDLSGIAKQIF
jgi:regulator of replication initiation timing